MGIQQIAFKQPVNNVYFVQTSVDPKENAQATATPAISQQRPQGIPAAYFAPQFGGGGQLSVSEDSLRHALWEYNFYNGTAIMPDPKSNGGKQISFIRVVMKDDQTQSPTQSQWNRWSGAQREEKTTIIGSVVLGKEKAYYNKNLRDIANELQLDLEFLKASASKMQDKKTAKYCIQFLQEEATSDNFGLVVA